MFQKAMDEYCSRTGQKPVSVRRDLQELLYEGISKVNKSVNLGNLLASKTKKVDPEIIVKFCKYMSITPNQLFGYEDNEGAEAIVKLNKIKEII